MHQRGANHAPRASVTQVNHSVHTLIIITRRGEPPPKNAKHLLPGLTGVAQKRLCLSPLIFGSSTVPGPCVFVACLSVSKLYFMDSKRLKGLKFIFLNFYYFVALTIVYIDLFPFCYNQIALSQCDFFTSMPC